MAEPVRLRPGIRLVLDFDSTIVRVESLDELAALALQKHPNRKALLKAIQTTTRLGMQGTLPFDVSLCRRLALFTPTREHIRRLVPILRRRVSRSFHKNRAFFRRYGNRIHILSGGFKEYIIPVVRPYGIPARNIHANSFLFDEKGCVRGFDASNPLASRRGKVKALKSLRLRGKIIAVGDGYSDYELKRAGLVDRFFAYTESVRRRAVTAHADGEAHDFDEIIRVLREEL